MPNKTPAIISAITTILLLLVFGLVSVIFQLIALNGVSEDQGVAAMSRSFACQGVIAVLAGISAGWLTYITVAKFNWNKVLGVLIAVIAGTTLGALISFLAFIILLPIAGIG